MAAKKCALCSRFIVQDSNHGRYCVYHTQAYDALVAHYNSWNAAYGKLSWNEYLEKMIKMQETGHWIRQIAEAELQKEKEKK